MTFGTGQGYSSSASLFSFLVIDLSYVVIDSHIHLFADDTKHQILDQIGSLHHSHFTQKCIKLVQIPPLGLHLNTVMRNVKLNYSTFIQGLIDKMHVDTVATKARFE